MRNMLRRLWPRRTEDPFLDRGCSASAPLPLGLDLAHGDWTPPPPSEVGTADWSRWLCEEAPRPRTATPPQSESLGPKLSLTLPSALVDRSDDIVGTWAEPAELEELTLEPAPEPPPAEPVAPAPASPRRRRDTLGGGRARIRTPLPERRWRDLLTQLAEHLTDEELAIIRKQMAK